LLRNFPPKQHTSSPAAIPVAQPWIPTGWVLPAFLSSSLRPPPPPPPRSSIPRARSSHWPDFPPLLIWFLQHRPSSGNNSSFWTTNSGAPVWNNNSALTVGQRGRDPVASLLPFIPFSLFLCLYEPAVRMCASCGWAYLITRITWLFRDDLWQPRGIRAFFFFCCPSFSSQDLWAVERWLLTLDATTNRALLVAMIIQSLHLDANFAVPIWSRHFKEKAPDWILLTSLLFC
jgi:hypothetical protein